MKSKTSLLVAIFAATVASSAAIAQSSSAGASGASGGSYGTEDISQPGYQGAEQSSTPRDPSMRLMQGDANQAFGQLDSDGNDSLSREDVSNIHGFNFEYADRNKDGNLTSEEFARAWTTPDADTYKAGM